MAIENIARRGKLYLKQMPVAVSALAIFACLCSCTGTDDKPASGPLEKVTIAYATQPETALAQVAQSQGYYREEGLQATAHLHPYGKPALKEVLEGKADFATVAETPVMFAIMNGEKISVIATIQTSSLGNAILARKDRGIRALTDLSGKTIAATFGTTSHFFLDAILGINGISLQDVKVVDLQAEEIPQALARGDIDAVSTFNPYLAIAQKKLGKRLITFRDKDVYRYTFNVVATREFIRMNPGKVRKMLHALIKAEEFVRNNPGAAQKIVADFSGIEPAIVRDIWADYRFDLTLEQSLILTLEYESRWAIKSGLVKARKVPNYLQYIYFDGLDSVKPEAVSILR